MEKFKYQNGSILEKCKTRYKQRYFGIYNTHKTEDQSVFPDIFAGIAYALVSDISPKICCLAKAGEKSAALKKTVCFFPSA